MSIIYSFIIPHKNCPDLLKRCVNSIPVRDDVQIIIVDDNSDKGKKAAITRREAEVVLLDRESSKGAGRARNEGLKRATGKWLVFADSDDFFTESLLVSLDKYKDSEADLILFKADSVDSDTLEKSNRHGGINAKIDSVLNGEEDARLVALEIEVPWCKMVRNDFVQKNQITFDEVLASNDTMFSTKVTCLANNIEMSEDVLYVVTTRTGSLWNTRKKPANYLSRICVYINRCKYLKEHGYPATPLIMSYMSLGYIDVKTNIKALWLILKNGCMFSGMGSYVVKQYKKRRKRI